MVEFSLWSLMWGILKLLYNLIQISLKFNLGHFNFTQIQFIQMIIMQSNEIGCSILSTVKRRQQGKVPTPFWLVRPGPDSERPSVPFQRKEMNSKHTVLPRFGPPG